MAAKSDAHRLDSFAMLKLDQLPICSVNDARTTTEHVYAEHHASIYRYLVLTGSAPPDAEELVQEAFLRLFRFLQVGRKVDRPKNWLISVVHNLRSDQWQKENRERSVFQEPLSGADAQPVDAAPDPEASLLLEERTERLRQAMDRLTERQCAYLHLRAEGLKLREIAELYGVSVQAVAEASARAIHLLGRMADE